MFTSTLVGGINSAFYKLFITNIQADVECRVQFSPHICLTCVIANLWPHSVQVGSYDACHVMVKDNNTDGVYLDINHGQSLLGSAVVSRHSVHRLRNVIQNQVQIHFIFLWK